MLPRLPKKKWMVSSSIKQMETAIMGLEELDRQTNTVIGQTIGIVETNNSGLLLDNFWPETRASWHCQGAPESVIM